MATSTSSTKLFEPIKVGNLELSTHIVMPPLGRLRSDAEGIPSDASRIYYAQRSATPGTLIIAEGLMISPSHGGFPNLPGLYTDTQIQSWKKITDAVHQKGSYIFAQIWMGGRTVLTGPHLAPSPLGIDGYPVPRELTREDIKEIVQVFASAADRAVNQAGFDGVELHGANGFLIEQFIQDVSNQRTDEYGSSIENRIRFPLEVIEAVSKAVGAERTALRLSPWSRLSGMRMINPIPTYSRLVEEIRDQFSSLAYLHLVEPRFEGADEVIPESETDSNDFLREIWRPRPFISAGGYTRSSGIEHAERTNDLIAYGRYFIANPDLVERLKKDLPIAKGNRATYYTGGPEGYITYPTHAEASRQAH